MNKYKGDLTRVERLEISILLQKGYSKRAIARELVRSPNTISYEIKHNSTNNTYKPIQAHAKARHRKKYRKLQYSKIERSPQLKEYVVSQLKESWNPDEISGYLKRTKKQPYVSKTAIYDWLRTSRGERYCVYLYSKRKYVKKRKEKMVRVMIPNRVGIEGRFKGATNRTRYGHHESDTIVGKKGTPGGLKVVQERKSRLVDAQKVQSMRPKEHVKVEKKMLQNKKVLSVTYDNGIENKEHAQLGVSTYFCNPYSSWEKGGVENANKMLRRYFPKGTDFRTVTQKQVDEAVRFINNKPRKIHGYRSSLEIAREVGIFKSIKSGVS